MAALQCRSTIHHEAAAREGVPLKKLRIRPLRNPPPGWWVVGVANASGLDAQSEPYIVVVVSTSFTRPTRPTMTIEETSTSFLSTLTSYFVPTYVRAAEH